MRSLVVAVLIAGGVAVPVGVAQAHSGSDGGQPDAPGTAQMHELMQADNPGMVQMCERMHAGASGQAGDG